MHVFGESLGHALAIASFVFAMMVLVDYINVLTRGKMSAAIRGGQLRQYVITSFLGSTPGCLGSFMNVSFYLRGLISFGAIAGGMIATCGDEAFVMLALFPAKAVLLFAILFVVGIISAFLVDRFVAGFGIKTCEGCGASAIHKTADCRTSGVKEVFEQLRKLSLVRFLLVLLLAVFLYAFISGLIGHGGWDWKRVTFIFIITLTLFIVLTVPEHYLRVHIWEHIAKRHLWRILLWSFGALLIVRFAMDFVDLKSFVGTNVVWVILFAAVFGLIPESGPHLIFAIMFAKGMVPFSVLVTSSIVQDGHGILPLLSHSVKDSVLIKLCSLVTGLTIGIILYMLGL